MLNTNEQSVSAVTVALSYPAYLEFVGSDVTGSAFDTSLGDPKITSQNTLTFSRLRLSAGFTGIGEVAKLVFEPNTVGDGTLTIDPATSEVTSYTDFTNILNPNDVPTLAVHVTAAPTTPVSTPTDSLSQASLTASPNVTPTISKSIVTSTSKLSPTPTPENRVPLLKPRRSTVKTANPNQDEVIVQPIVTPPLQQRKSNFWLGIGMMLLGLGLATWYAVPGVSKRRLHHFITFLNHYLIKKRHLRSKAHRLH